MNTAAGEKEIKLGERTYVLRPSFEALVEMEARTNLSIQTLLQQAASGQLKASHTVAVLYACMKEGLRDGETIPSFNDFGKACYLANVINLMHTAGDLVSVVCTQGREPKKGESAEGEEKKT